MDTKTKFGFFTALFILFGLMSAQAQSVVYPKAYYDAITYEWTDAGGVSHTNALTDVATDPYQIVALLKKVYCDPNVPGPKYSAYTKNGEREREVYYGPVAGGWNISADDVIPPYEEGYTLLMVAVKEQLHLYNGDTPQGGWWGNTYESNFFTQTSELLNYIGDNIASVQLLTDGLRIGEGQKQGTVYNISGTYNRFFMIGKGQAREKDRWVTNYENQHNIIAGERVPFKQMFEEFSPTTGDQGAEIKDFYAKMMKGDIYNVVHDCASVIQVEHYFSMDGKKGHDAKSLTGLNIFIPDYRLLYWEDQYKNGSGWYAQTYTVDGRTLNPYKDANGNAFSNNPSYLCANYGNYNPSIAPKVGIYLIQLDADATPGSEEKTYDVLLDWTSSLDKMSGDAVPQQYTVYIILTDEEGNEVLDELVITGETTYTYTVPQNEHSYTITYIVYGQPTDGTHNEFVAWSNTDDVIIPGWNDFLGLNLNHYESDYVGGEQNNYYRNFLSLENPDMLNALTVERVMAGENNFILYRYDTSYPEVLIPVAELNLTASYTTGGANYEIAYDNQEPLPGYDLDITTSGHLVVDANGALVLDQIQFVDQFTANTALNDHPNRYGYLLALESEGAMKTTNSVEVPVFKTTSAIDGFYTLDEVNNDVDGTLTANVKNANVKMSLSTNPAIYYYTLNRGDNNYPNEPISKMQRRSDGTYLEMLNVLPQYFNTVEEPGIVNRLDNNVVEGVIGDYMSYEPIIWTFGNDRVKQDGENSYGSPVYRTGIAGITCRAKGTYSSTEYGTWRDENNEVCHIYNPTIYLTATMPTDASVEYEPYMYRVWRLCKDVRGYTVNPKTKVPSNDPSADRSAKKLIIEEVTDMTEPAFGDNHDDLLAFGAIEDAKVEFLTRMYYKKVGDSGIRSSNEPLYYVVETLQEWTDKIVGVNEINTSTIVSRTYYNAQGIQSDKPFDGVNIVITRHSDGSTTTGKLIK